MSVTNCNISSYCVFLIKRLKMVAFIYLFVNFIIIQDIMCSCYYTIMRVSCRVVVEL